MLIIHMTSPISSMIVEADSQGEGVDVKIYTMNKVFNSSNRKQRVEKYVNGVYCDSNENRKIRKAYRNQLMDIIKSENDFIKESLRVIQKKKPMRKRKRREYKPTPYVKFCREMRQNHSHNELAGHMQRLWRERRGLKEKVVTVKEEPVEEKKQEYNAKDEKERYIKEMKERFPELEEDSDSDSD